jgi:hypothetical protein
MIVRFDIRPDPDGWTIYDRSTDLAAVVDGIASTGLRYVDADEVVDLLNTLDLLKGSEAHGASDACDDSRVEADPQARPPN